MTPQDFALVQKLLLDHCAIALEPGKEYLVNTRLAPVARRLGMESVDEFLKRLRRPGALDLVEELIDAMVTTETSFFRDIAPFETLRKVVLPELINARRQDRRLSIWCAASSSGQEPYTVALVLKEYFPELANWTVRLVATDISPEMLRRSREGRYSQIEVNRGMPVQLLMKYFQQDGAFWRLRDDVRNMVDFQQLNLAQPWPTLPPMDLVLLRNVMIYFEVETKKDILRRVAKLLRPDGYLVLGGAETTFNLDDSYRRAEELKSGFYRLVQQATKK